MDLGINRDLQHIGLPTACAEVYAAITGSPPDARYAGAMQEILNEVARAMAYVVRIYAESGGWPRPIGGFDALQGTFSDGAHTFTNKSGQELRKLTVQRRDLMRAIEVLRSARIRFRARSAA